LSELAYRELTRSVAGLEKKRQYDDAITRCLDYQTLFADSPRIAAVRKLQDRMQDQKDMVALAELASAKGQDYEAARMVYKNYLDEHPQTSQKGDLQKEIEVLELKIRSRSEWQQVVDFSRNRNYGASERMQKVRQFVRKNPTSPFVQEAQALVTQLEDEALAENRLRQQVALQQQAAAQEQEAEAQRQSERLRLQRLAENIRAQIKQSQGRYLSSGDEIIKDSTTGLMWAILDSQSELGRCLNYDSAMNYVRNLRNGGFSDWRMPTTAELAGIYKNYPFFPATGAQWYWTSETYVKGYNRIANVVTTKRETVFKREYFDLDQCGAVRAVRP
jgi:broad specificity phosphatase PhoE